MSKITQAALRKYLMTKKRISELEAQLKETEQTLTEQLKKGASVQDGVLTAFLKIWERRNVSWKDVVERELGEDYCTRVLGGTRPETYTKLVVESV